MKERKKTQKNNIGEFMTTLLDIYDEIEQLGVKIIEVEMVGKLKAVYIDSYIFIERGLSSNEKRCILKEELNHHKYDLGNILEKKSDSLKSENRTRRRTYEELIPLHKLKQTMKRCETLYELADELNVTEEFLQESFKHYECKHGISFLHNTSGVGA